MSRRWWLLILVCIAAGIAYFTLHTQGGAGGGAGMQMAAPQVSVMTVKAEPMDVWAEFSGKLTAVDYAEIRPEVSGRITSIQFKDGQMVKAGDVLLTIDPRPYEAALAQAKAAVVAARSNAAFAKTDKTRAESLIKSQTISKRLYDEREASSTNAQSLLDAAEAELKQAQVNVERAYVRAPISGKISRPELTVGNVVQAGPGAPLLTSIASTGDIYADFEVDEQTYLTALHEGAGKADYQLELKLSDGSTKTGKLKSFDNRISPESGTIRARAVFENPDNVLIPGMYITVRMAANGGGNVIAVPERVIGTDQSKKYVIVVGADNTAEYRIVTLGASSNGMRIITSGLKEGETIVVEGLQHVQPGKPVAPKSSEAPAASPSADQASPENGN